LSFQVFSHDSIIQTSAGENDYGNRAKHSDSHFHSLSSLENVLKITLSTLSFFSCFSKIEIHFERVIHEFNIVEKRRKKITLSFIVKDCFERI
jgi:hypothetical protein